MYPIFDIPITNLLISVQKVNDGLIIIVLNKEVHCICWVHVEHVCILKILICFKRKIQYYS